MAFPAGTPTVTLVGTIPSAVAGTAYRGKIVCKPSAYLVDAGRNAVYPGGGSVTFDSSGSFSVVLLPCDASGIQPQGWLWFLDLQPTGGTRIQFYANITGTGTVHFDNLTPVPAPGGGPGAGNGAVSSVNGQVGAVNLTAADVQADPAGSTAAAVSTHAAASDPHGDRAAATAALASHEADTTSVHGITNTAALETQSGAQSKADAAQATAASTAADDATAKVSAHTAASDPHGDRAYADGKLAKTANLSDLSSISTARSNLGLGGAALLSVGTGAGTVAAGDDSRFSNARTPTTHAASHASGGSDPITPAAIGAYPQASGSALDVYVNDALNRLAAIENGTAFLAGLNTTGHARVINSDLRVEGTSGTVRHRFDGAANTVGLYGATPVAQQTVSGSRADGTAAASLLSALATLGLVTDSSTAGPAGPGWADRPSDQNLLVWTYDPNMAGHVTAQSNAGVAGRVTLVRIILREAITWSNIWIGLAGIDAAAVLSNCYLGVYSTAGALLGTTADISASLMTGANAKALPLVTPFSAPAGTYFIAMLLNGTWATNSLTFKASGAGISVNAGLSAPNLRYSNLLTTQTSLPSSLTLSTQATSIINTGWASQWYGVS